MNDLFVINLENSNHLCIIDIDDAVKCNKHKWTILETERNFGTGEM